MTDTEKLRGIIKTSGYKIRYIAKYAGLSYQALLNKMNNVSDFRICEIIKLCNLLHINSADRDEIFFADNVAEISNK